MAKKSPKTDRYGRPTESIFDPAIDGPIIRDHRLRKPVHLDYVVEVARNYHESFGRIENARRRGYDRETLCFLQSHQDKLAEELRELCQPGDGYGSSNAEQGAEWKLLQPIGEVSSAMATEIVQRLSQPSVIPSAKPEPEEGDDWIRLGDFEFRTGQYRYQEGKQFNLAGREWQLLKMLARAKTINRRLTKTDMASADAVPDSVRSQLTSLRNILRENHALPGNPIPYEGKGSSTTWSLEMEKALAPPPKQVRSRSQNKRRINVRGNVR